MFTLEEQTAVVDFVRNGMTYREASKLTGIPRQTIWNWRQKLDKMDNGAYPLKNKTTQVEKGAFVDFDKLPNNSEELKHIIFDQQFEIDVMRAVVDIIKKDPGVDPKTLPNKEKAMLIDALAKQNPQYSISFLTSSLNLAPATFYYHKKRLGEDKDAALREQIIRICAEHPEFGYRRVKRMVDAENGNSQNVSEKRIRRIMKEEGLQPPRRRKCSRYSSYDSKKDTGEELPNIPLNEKTGKHDFSAPAPNILWVSDVTEFRLPSDERVYLSPVLDCFDSTLPGWMISTSEKADDLTNPSLEKATKSLREEDECCIHTDKGGHYFDLEWIKICDEYNITRSMSRKGYSPDNARMEGFFGRLKMEFFDTRDWKGVSVEVFIEELNAWLVYYNEKREKESLGWLAPMEYRRQFVGAV